MRMTCHGLFGFIERVSACGEADDGFRQHDTSSSDGPEDRLDGDGLG
jgi:hypothetical protein